jgi:hypothetical protein
VVRRSVKLLLKNPKAEIESPRALADPSCSLAGQTHKNTYLISFFRLWTDLKVD